MTLELNFTFDKNDNNKKQNKQQKVYGNRNNRMQYRRNLKRNQERKNEKAQAQREEKVEYKNKAAKPIQNSDDEQESEVPAKQQKFTKDKLQKPIPKDFSEKESGSKSSFRLFKDLPDCEAIEAPENVAQITEEVFDDNSFANLTPGLHEYLVKNLKDEGKVKMTRVQREALPHALSGKDLKVKAQTGSGKTLVYRKIENMEF